MLMLNGNHSSIPILHIDPYAMKTQQTKRLSKRSPLPLDLDIYDEDEFDEQPLPKLSLSRDTPCDRSRSMMKRPTLQRTNANQVLSAKLQHSPCSYLDGYASHSYLCFARIVATRYLHKMQRQLDIVIPSELVQLCTDFSYVYEDGVRQISIYLSSVLRKRNKTRISRNVLHVIIAQYFQRYGQQTLSNSQVQCYYDEMVRLQCIVSMRMKHAQYIGFPAAAPMTYYKLSKSH